MIRVVLVDDQTLVRTGFRMILTRGTPGSEVIRVSWVLVAAI